MGGDPIRRNQSLYCTYHWDKGHTTEQCRVFNDHLEQLVKYRYPKEFVVDPENGAFGQASRSWGNALPPMLGMIKVIHVASMGTSMSQQKGVLTIVSIKNDGEDVWLENKMKLTREPIAFGGDDLEGTTQPHDNALVVTALISKL